MIIFDKTQSSSARVEVTLTAFLRNHRSQIEERQVAGEDYYDDRFSEDMMTIVMIVMVIIGHHDDRMMMIIEKWQVAGGDYNYDQHRDDIIMMRMDGCIPIPVTSDYREC